ncbi:MAG: lipid-binding SYLF domain-containing protein, partial [Steroidobacteraceae bacterium]
MKLFSRTLVALLAAGFFALPAQAASREEATIEQALTVLHELQAIPDTRIPDLLLSKAEGIIILPANVKVGLMFGARFGNGVMLVRNADRSWSNPVFVSTGGGSWGLQAGGQVSDIVLVINKLYSVEGITDGKLTLGAD